MTVTPDRQENVDFSDSYAKGVQVIIVKDGSDIASPDDLEGKSIGVQTGTTGDIYCTDDYGQEHVKQFNNGPLAVAALVNDQVDCVVIDQEPALYSLLLTSTSPRIPQHSKSTNVYKGRGTVQRRPSFAVK